MSTDMPVMLRLLLHHFLIGAVAAVIFGGLLLWSDLAGLATVIGDSQHREFALFLLFAGLISTFGPIAMLTGILGQKDEENSPER